MNRPNLTQLSKEIYEANKLKGWHEQEYSNEHHLCLVISELMEAVEADREGRRADLDRFNKFDNDNLHDWLQGEPNGFADNFQQNIKDSIEDELDDAVIRLLDLAGVRGIEVLDENFKFYEDNSSDFKESFGKVSFVEQIYYCVDLTIYSKFFMVDKISEGIAFIEALCKNILSIDLWLHVSLKLKYNLNRSYKHGKEY